MAFTGLLSLLACSSSDRPPRLVDGNGTGAGGRSRGGESSGGAASTGAGQGGSAMAGLSGATGNGGSSGSGGVEAVEPSCIPRQSCRRLCDVLGTDPACGLGNVVQCGCACEERFNGPCPDELEALLGCAGGAPSIDCGARGRIFPGCEDESFALEICDFRAREQLCAGSYPDCTPFCRGALLGFCPLGPESLASCLCGCEASLVTSCAGEFAAFMTCSSQSPAFDCDTDGRILATTCPSEWQALSSCMTAAANASGG